MHSMAKSQKLRNIFIPALVVMLTIGLSPGFGLSATHQIYPTADACVFSGSAADKNYGTINDLYVRIAGYPATYAYSFLKFDLSSMPSAEIITGVTLYAYCYSATTPITPTIQLRPVSDTTWLETGITWNNQPPYGNLIVATLGTIGWKEWSIPVANLPETGLVSFLLMTQTYGSSQFYSKESATNRPYLQVTTTVKPKASPGNYLLLLD
ncbi:MAG: DNRLRE domain-containing protein [Desulfobacterales bacterium]|nr:DNRLRE domain-containing protein [Pseudomonadota bacterium]MBU4354138.1 DNRLRE domain-containing protein [Pseudomonadota bacterium]MCG2773240.1 DNRLRE domain-containing protein [Desulfobacterales bacterium]